MITINKVYNRAGQPLFTLEDSPNGEYSNAGSLIDTLRNQFRQLDNKHYEELFKLILNERIITKISIDPHLCVFTLKKV